MYHGILVVWKEAGMTSHDVIYKLRKILGMKKIGHTGTLDPNVEGVLAVCLGHATKLVEFMMEGHKIYQGQISLGQATETEDSQGRVIQEKAVVSPISHQEIDQAMASFVGRIRQVPPYYSAVKVKGWKLYEYARLGIEVERPVRQADIYDFYRLGPSTYDSDKQRQVWDFQVDCGKGTYVRTLAVDLGQKLGYPAHMSKLRRISTSNYSQDQALTLAEIESLTQEARISDYILPMETALPDMPRFDINEDQYQDIKFGKVLPLDYFGDDLKQDHQIHYQGQLIGIYYPHPDKPHLIKPRKMFI